MRVSRGALVAGGVGLAAAGTLVVRKRSRRKNAEETLSAEPAETVAVEIEPAGEPKMTIITEETPGDLPLTA